MAMFSADPNSEIHTFDHTVNQYDWRVANKREFTFHPWGVGGRSSGNIRSLHDITKELGHTYISVLKVCLTRRDASIMLTLQ